MPKQQEAMKADAEYIKEYHYLTRYALAELVDETEGVVLDLAAGHCITTRALDKHGRIGVAVEISHNYIQHSSSISVLADCERLPFRDNVFDSGLCRAALHHFEEPEVLIGEGKRVIKTGGKFIFLEPVKKTLTILVRSVFNKTINVLRRLLPEEDNPIEDYIPVFHTSYTRTDLEDLFGVKARIEPRFGFSGVYRRFNNRLIFWVTHFLDRFFKKYPWQWLVVVRVE